MAKAGGRCLHRKQVSNKKKKIKTKNKNENEQTEAAISVLRGRRAATLKLVVGSFYRALEVFAKQKGISVRSENSWSRPLAPLPPPSIPHRVGRSAFN